MIVEDKLKRVPVREQEPAVRAKNFDEVCLGYNLEEAMAEATRCLKCKNPQCQTGCPVGIDIPGFVKEVEAGNIKGAYDVISRYSALPAICGRVCPQETQCEAKCIRGIKGDAVSIGKLERFTADWARENGVKPQGATEKKGQKVAVIGSGPSGLTCAGELAKMINGQGWLKNGVKCNLTVIPVKNYTRKTRYVLPVPPSPNLPSERAVRFYPFLCLFDCIRQCP